jgi:hypothetical protein
MEARMRRERTPMMGSKRTARWLRKGLAAVMLALTGLTAHASVDAAVAAAQIPGTMTVQGILRDTEGRPVEGTVPFVMELKTATRSLWTESQSATLQAGLFTLTLGDTTPIDPTLFDGGPVSLVVTVDGEEMAPIPLTAVPYAFRAASADTAATAETAENYAGDVDWAQLTGVPAGFADGTDDGNTYAAGAGLALTGNTFSVDTAAVQARISGTCAPGQSIRAIGADGSVICEIDDSGTAGTTYAAGTGLSLAGTTFAVDTAAIQARVTGSCAAGESIRAIGADGRVSCEADDNTTYAAGTGLSLAGTTFAVDTAAIQARVTGSCAAGQAIASIGVDGTVTCETDDNTTYAAGTGLSLAGTTFAVNTAAIQARVSGTCAAGQAIASIGVDGTVTCETDDNTTYAAGTGLSLAGTTFAVNTAAIQARVTGSCAAGQAIASIGSDGTVSCVSASGDPTADTIADDGVISDAEASDSLSISNGLLVAPAGGTLVDVNGELRSNGLIQVGASSPGTYEISTRRYIVDAPPANVGRVVPIDSTVMDALCRDADGCMMTLGMINWDGTQNNASRSQKLFIAQSARSWRFANVDLDGTDSNGSVQEWSAWDCFLTDAETWTGTTNGRADPGVGWALLNVQGGSYSDTTTTCRVIFED